jgi:hypothetical protein
VKRSTITTGLELAAVVALSVGAFLLAGLGGLLIAAAGVLAAASYVLSRGSR